MSDLDDINSWTLKKVQFFLDTYHIEYDCLEEDELRCLAYSLPIERDKVVQAELMTVFPLDADLIDSLLESTSYIVTNSLISELKDLCEFQNQDEGLYDNNSSMIPINFSSFQSIDKFPRIAVGSTVIAEENEVDDSGYDNDDGHQDKGLRLQTFKIGNQTRACVLETTQFGIHDWSISLKNDDKQLNKFQAMNGTLFCTSSTFEYATALDVRFDLFYWGLGYGSIWNDDLKNSLSSFM